VSAVSISGLSFRYPDGRLALDGLNLEVAEGESLGIIGANGSGKTTLLMHLNGLLKGHGRVAILGMDPAGRDRAAVRATVGLLFQDPDDQLFCPTVMEDAEFGPLNLGLAPDEARRRALEALSQAGLEGYGDRSPHHMSAGEKKRAALAAVLAMKPRMLVLDEPSAHLDPRARREMMALLSGLPYIRIIASHDLDMVGHLCQRVVLLSAGRVAADRKTADILGDRKLLEENGL
jgi:cobalt/nickel transport system ATP-binding protein